ncbi:MAG: hypothetical protein HYU41_03180 [Candidatus Rokubacteria bacterium]|nr:hypothetical protein [Candidatus Rokubacteria bacterium]
MISRVQLSTLIAAAALVWGVLLIAAGATVGIEFARPFNTVIGVLVILLWVCERWGWRWQLLHPWFVATPVLHGTWRGQIVSTWIDPATGRQVAPIEAYVAITQTASTIRMRMMTRESQSELLGASIVSDADGLPRLYGTYRNTPRQEVRHRSAIHHGALFLDIHSEPPRRLDGQYWTDRNTTGSLSFDARCHDIHRRFEDARNGRYRG